jgi:multidrug efflux system membrane fusion protein
MRPIKQGATEGNDVQVTSGLAPGDIVVTDGQDKLQDGSKVNPQVTGTNNAGSVPAGRGGRRGEQAAPPLPGQARRPTPQ